MNGSTKKQMMETNDNEKFMETNDNENTTVQNLWDTTKAVLRGKYIADKPFSRNKKGLKYTT